MADKIHVRPLGRLARFIDVLITPLMYIISGTFREAPQRTHRWNNAKLKPQQVQHLDEHMLVPCDGIKAAGARFWLRIPFFHIPIFGGWKNYVVLQPLDPAVEWNVGWIADDVAGVSRIKVRGPVRMLLGPGDVSFFGIDSEGNQISIHKIAHGCIGDGGPYAHVPLH